MTSFLRPFYRFSHGWASLRHLIFSHFLTFLGYPKATDRLFPCNRGSRYREVVFLLPKKGVIPEGVLETGVFWGFLGVFYRFLTILSIFGYPPFYRFLTILFSVSLRIPRFCLGHPHFYRFLSIFIDFLSIFIDFW